MTGEGFRGVSLRKSLVDEVERFIAEFGRYKNVTEFVSESTRLRLEELQKQYQNTQETTVIPITKEAPHG